jgi:uncharacterized repeat protein (TIGR01451 family)
MINGFSVGTYKISSTFVGEVSICTITVQDSTPPVLELQPVQIDIGESVSVDHFVKNAEDPSGEVEIRLMTTLNTKEVGTHTVVIEAEDIYGNVVSAETTLQVRLDSKPPVFSGVKEIVVEKKAKKSKKKGKPSAKSTSKTTEDSEIGTITSHSYSTTSAKPKLTLVKQQAVNGGEKTSESVKARPGDTITYYLTLTNDESSESAAKDVDIVDDIPKGMKYVEGSAVGDATVSNGSVRWTIGSLKAGQSVLVSYQASIPEDAEAATYSGTANASCYIESSEDSPKTADENQPGLWLASTTASIGTALGGAAAIRRKRRG